MTGVQTCALPISLLRPLGGRPPRLAVYQHAYRARLGAALRDNHPVLHRVLGDEAFDALAQAYAERHPSRHPSIRWHGAQLADALAAGLIDGPPALVDLARLEWAAGLCGDAADAPALTQTDLADLSPDDWPALALQPHPSVQCLCLDWDVTPLWRTLRDTPDAEVDAPPPRRHTVLLWRQGLGTHWRLLDTDEADALAHWLPGTALGDLLAWSAERLGPADGPARVSAWLHRWLADGLLRRT